MSNTTKGRKITGTTCTSRKEGGETAIYNADGERIGAVVPTRGLSSDWGNKWQTGQNGVDREQFMNLRESARYFMRRA